MSQLNEFLTFTVPLSFKAHSLAEQFRREQSIPQKAKQIYLNTLAVYAVDFYLQCLGVETEAEKSDSRNPLCLKFMNVADLLVKSIGRLECCPILSESTVMHIPVEARTDRVGYVAVRLEQSLKQATLLGFTPTAVAELPISQLKALAELPEYLHQLQQIRIPVNLRHWLDSLKESLLNSGKSSSPEELTAAARRSDDSLEEGWQRLEVLFSPEELTTVLRMRSSEELVPEFRTRSSSIERGKKICLATQMAQQTIILVVKLNPQSEEDINIVIEVRPIGGQLYLPETLHVKILDEKQTAVMQATASNTNQNIRFDFNAYPGEYFSVKITLEETSVIENFVI
jgi:Protein of unknown function (DUF1822)